MCVCMYVCVRVSVWKFSPLLKIMDSISYQSKFELRQMKLISYALVKDFQRKNCIVCLVSKSAKKIDYLKYIVAYLCPSATEILNLPYQPFVSWMVLAFNTFMSDGNKKLYTLKQSNSSKKQVWCHPSWKA